MACRRCFVILALMVAGWTISMSQAQDEGVAKKTPMGSGAKATAIQPAGTNSPDTEPTDEEKTDAEVLVGHSSHGESFNEGPRQKAALIGGTGLVTFPVTTDKPLAQKFVEQGVGQLFGFWKFEAERSFRQAAAIDPECAMAYWSMAMANLNNTKRAPGFIAEAVKRRSKTTPRERKYIDAVDAYVKAGAKKNKERSQAIAKAYERIVYEFPEDLEAKDFLGLQLYTNRGRGIPISSYLAVDALLKEVVAKEPLHSVHHFR